MSEVITVKIVGDKALAAKLATMSREIVAAGDKAALAAGLSVEGFAKKNFRTVSEGGQGSEMGPPVPGQLTSRQGTLRSSIHVEKAGEGSVRVGPGPLKYAAIHEFGGEIVARTAKALRFQLYDGTWRTMQRVRIPKRPYMKPAIESQENIASIRATIVTIMKRELGI